LPDARLAVVGHTDSTGDFAYNVDLSARRAQSVIEALITDHTIERTRLVGLGAGPIDPLASNATPGGRAMNRRVTFILITEVQGASADEVAAKKLLKSMSDYMAAQEAISFGYDSTLEVVTTQGQKLALASSGTVILNRPDKIRATRSGGFADVETLFDGKTLTLLGKTANLYTQIDVPGTVDHLVDELKDKYDRPLPASDLLMINSYDELMADVTDAKDLGSGVINGVECDFLAFRNVDVDWQIWIAHGDRPYPCRYVITSKKIADGPQYSIQVRDWKTGDEVAVDDFSFKNPSSAKKIDPKDLQDMMSELPQHFKRGHTQ
jgi:hypothetical protein